MTVRTTPLQARSAARIAELLEACAGVVEEVGIEHVTTNLVAERAGCSIGTIYRYFPDRIAVIRALGLRQCLDIIDATELRPGAQELGAEGTAQFLGHLVDDFFRWHRTAPGASALGYAHLLDTPVTEDEARIFHGRFTAGLSPRDQISRDVAERLVGSGHEESDVKAAFDYLAILALALADRAGAITRCGNAGGEDPYVWSRRCLEVTIRILDERFEELRAAFAATGPDAAIR